MKIDNLKIITKTILVSSFTFFLCHVGTGNCQQVSEGIELKGTNPISNEKTFQLKKFEEPLPEKKIGEFVCEVDLPNKTIKVKKKNGEEFYQITIPSIETLSPKLKRYDGEAFREANATLNGDIILCYHEMDEFYYSKRDNSFYLLPRYTKEEDNEYQFDEWEQIDDNYFLSGYFNRVTNGAGYALFHKETKKIYKVKIPADIIFENEYIALGIFDPLSRIVHAKRCKDSDPRDCEDLVVIADVGYYKIEEVVETP